VTTSALRRVAAIPGAVMLGVGAILLPKSNADDHWSETPTVALVEDSLTDGSGAPRR
jgi:hypothetical protein